MNKDAGIKERYVTIILVANSVTPINVAVYYTV